MHYNYLKLVLPTNFSMLIIMKLILFFIIISGVILILSACDKWESWEQLLTNKSSNAPKESQKVEISSEPKPEPIVTPGEYNLTAPNANVPFILYVPSDYTPKKSFPIIFCYHGAGVSATTWPFYQVTHGNGYIIVGMNYSSEASSHLGLEFIRYEKALFLEALEMVSARLNVDQSLIFMGGYSQGGYATSLLGERIFDKLAGLIILGAGRYAVDRYPPSLKSIKGKPIFVGVGGDDTVHNPRAKLAANYYQGLWADVTFEVWAGVSHGINTTEFPSKILLNWLNNIVALQIAKNQKSTK
jgi:predicted esterase